jgi:biotin carboxylase
MAKLLLLGRRAGAERAAAALGFEPVVLAPPRRAVQAQGAYGATPETSIALATAALAGAQPAAVVAVAEGAAPAAARVRAHYGLPGLPFATAERCNDKALMKDVVVAAGIPCARGVHVGAATTAAALIDELGLPVVLKLPVSSGGRGVWIATDEAAVRSRIAAGMLAESFTVGVEMSVETLSHAGRVVFRSYTEYLDPRWANLVPASLAGSERVAIDAVVDAALAALGVDTGITHVELFRTERGPVFGELAARPPGGRLMELMELVYGFDPWRALLEVALGREPTVAREPTQCAAVHFLHPGPGRVAGVRGVEAARALEGVARVHCRVAPGDTVAVRVGSGQNVGEVIVVASDRSSCVERLRRAHAAISIELEPT